MFQRNNVTRIGPDPRLPLWRRLGRRINDLGWQDAVLGPAVVVATAVFGTNVLGFFLSEGLVRVGYFSLYALFGAVLAANPRALAWITTRVPLLLIVLIFPILSTFWSVDPAETAQRGIAVLGSSLAGICIGVLMTLRQGLKAMAVGFCIVAALNIGTVVFSPETGIASGGSLDGSWLGMEKHKNRLGELSAIGALVIWYAFVDGQNTGRARLMFGLFFLVSLVLLVGSQSATGLVAGLVVMLTTVGSRFMFAVRSNTLALTILTLLVVGAFVGLVSFPLSIEALFSTDTYLEQLGRESDLTSRLPIWIKVWDYLPNKYWLGWGYGVFWEAEWDFILSIVADLHFAPFYSHNGILELWLSGGLILVVLMAIILFRLLVDSIRYAAATASGWTSLYPLSVFGISIFFNVTEAHLLARNEMQWIIIVAAYVQLARFRGRAAPQISPYGSQAEPYGFRSSVARV